MKIQRTGAHVTVKHALNTEYNAMATQQCVVFNAAPHVTANRLQHTSSCTLPVIFVHL